MDGNPKANLEAVGKHFANKHEKVLVVACENHLTRTGDGTNGYVFNKGESQPSELDLSNKIENKNGVVLEQKPKKTNEQNATKTNDSNTKIEIEIEKPVINAPIDNDIVDIIYLLKADHELIFNGEKPTNIPTANEFLELLPREITIWNESTKQQEIISISEYLRHHPSAGKELGKILRKRPDILGNSEVKRLVDNQADWDKVDKFTNIAEGELDPKTGNVDIQIKNNQTGEIKVIAERDLDQEIKSLGGDRKIKEQINLLKTKKERITDPKIEGQYGDVIAQSELHVHVLMRELNKLGFNPSRESLVELAHKNSKVLSSDHHHAKYSHMHFEDAKGDEIGAILIPENIPFKSKL